MENQNGLLAGFAKIDITPDFPVGLAGYNNQDQRISKGVAEPIYITCIALTHAPETILIFTMDTVSMSHEAAELIREAVREATGIPGEKIFCAATHSHSCPAFLGVNSDENRAMVLPRAAEAAKQALADRAPAKIFGKKVNFPGMNSVRHVVLENGNVAMWDWQKQNSPFVRYAEETDDEMVLVKFAREEKKDILLVNWQGHPDCSKQIGFELIAPSFVGPLRDTLAAGSGMEVAYFTGGDGNVIIESIVPEHKHHLNWRRYGVRMASLALEALEDMEPVEASGIKTVRATVQVEYDHTKDHLQAQAQEVYDLWKATDKATGDKLGEKYGFSSVYQASVILSRAQKPETEAMEVNAFRIGDIGFTTGTYEMYASSGMQVKARSPFKYTMVLTGNWIYLPDEQAFKNRCYETDMSFFLRGAAEKMVDKYAQLLQEIQ